MHEGDISLGAIATAAQDEGLDVCSRGALPVGSVVARLRALASRFALAFVRRFIVLLDPGAQFELQPIVD